MGPEELNDEDLMTRVRAGCEESFLGLYRRHQGSIFRFALSMSGSGAVADEVVQEVFLAVLNGEVRFDPARGSLTALLVGVARNRVLRLLRSDGRFREDPAAGERAAGGSDAEDEIARRETIAAVRRAVLSLPPDYREVVALCDLEEMDYAEAAQVLGCPLGTVRSRLYRARALLAQKLQRAAAGGSRRLA
jgi:RNA polymerase sigma-70 factor (ECF subfamily)